MIKKYISTIIMASFFAVMLPLTAIDASAQTKRYASRSRSNVSSNRRVIYKRPNVYRRHRKAFNIGGGALAGALVGGLIGGKKGVVIGGLAGAGGGALYTHKQKPKNYVRRKIVRRTYRRN